MNESNKAKPGVALVTGAAKRIGRSISLELARNGWSVAVHYDGAEEEAHQTAEDIKKLGVNAVCLQTDLTDEKDTKRLVRKAMDALGPVTLLVNNASVFEYDKFEGVSRDSWDKHMETNLRAPFVLAQEFAAALPEDQPANIINIIDERVWNLTPHFTSYTLSKAGLWTLTQTMALALAPTIRVNAIGPGPTLPSPRQSKAQFDKQAASMPLGRGTSPEEIGRAITYILDMPAMTGQMIALDGGQHLAWSQPKDVSDPQE